MQERIMTLKNFLFRLAAILTAFMLGVGFFNAEQYVQSFLPTQETEAVETTVKKETLFVPPRVVPSPLIEPTPYVVNKTVADAKEETKPEFNPDGDYSIVGDLPKGFRDFELL